MEQKLLSMEKKELAGYVKVENVFCLQWSLGFEAQDPENRVKKKKGFMTLDYRNANSDLFQYLLKGIPFKTNLEKREIFVVLGDHLFQAQQ